MTQAVLPMPDAQALAASNALAARIESEIQAAGGWIGFDRYMQVVLYEPGLGYYSGGSVKLGAGGDFTTAPELSNALARGIAEAAAELLRGLSAPMLLELGAGTGALAEQLLDALDLAGFTDLPYRILEPSAELRQRQQQRLGSRGGRVEWLDRLPDAPVDGLIVANEVADALPAACFVRRGGDTLPLGVRVASAVGAGPGEPRFEWAVGPEDRALTAAVAQVERDLGVRLPDGYRSEIRPALPAWIGSLGDALRRGGVLLVDYGYPRAEFYHPQRSGGTLMCHYRHRAHGDPFLFPGLQDVTVWVDFSACAQAARAANLHVAGYTTQAQFLVEGLGTALVDERTAASPQALAALQALVLPGQMGERFKVMLLTRGIDGAALAGRDLRDRL